MVVAAAFAIVSGCRAPLPEHQWKDRDTALRVMSERGARVRTVESGVRLVLTSKDGNSVTLDGAIAAAPPDRFRLRAWKMGHAVLDLTLTPEGTWLKAEKGSGTSGAGVPPAVNARGIADAWSMFTGSMFSESTAPGGASTEIIDDGGPWFTLRRTLPARAGGGSDDPPIVECVIDRRTLTARRYRVIDSAGLERATLTLDDYRDFGGVVFPMRLSAESDDGGVLVLLDSPEFNLPTAPDAFVPPAGASRQE